MKSTKFDTCARLCQHLLTRDDAPKVDVVNGEVIYPPFPSLQPGESPQQTTKIIISMELTSLGPLLRNVSQHLIYLFALSTDSLTGSYAIWDQTPFHQWSNVISTTRQGRCTVLFRPRVSRINHVLGWFGWAQPYCGARYHFCRTFSCHT